ATESAAVPPRQFPNTPTPQPKLSHSTFETCCARDGHSPRRSAAVPAAATSARTRAPKCFLAPGQHNMIVVNKINSCRIPVTRAPEQAIKVPRPRESENVCYL